jgi:uncharacterized protein
MTVPVFDLCVFCRKAPVDPDWRPFCSKRCQLQDLARWADGAYRVPARSDMNAGHPEVDADDADNSNRRPSAENDD